jgi:Flp pilus assembly protein TadG
MRQGFEHPEQAGQTFAEFGLVAVVFFLLLFAVIKMAQTIFDYATICEAAREAARYAIVHCPTSVCSSSPNPATDAQIQQVAINAAPSLGLTTSEVSVNWPADSNLPSQTDAQIIISYPYTLSIPLMSSISLTLKGASQMLVSQ